MYIACQTTRNDSYIQWNEDLFHLITQEAIALRRQGFIVLALGDFNSRVGNITGLENNTPDINSNTPMFLNFATQVNMIIINTLPIAKGLFTRFMDNSGRPGTRSLLDYGLIDGDHSNTVTSFVIDEEARYAAGSDHALLECDVEFGARPKVTWSFQEILQYNINEKTDFTKYQNTLDTLASSIRLETFSTMSAEQMLPHITETLTNSAMTSFGLKTKKKQGGNKLPKNVIELLRAKNKISHDLHHADPNSADTERLHDQLEAMKVQIKDLILEVRLGRRQRLRNKLLKADPTRRLFWKFLKNQIKAAGNITAINDKSGKMVFDQEEIEEVILLHFENVFKGKRHPIHAKDATINQEEICLSELEAILHSSLPTTDPLKFEDEVCSPYTFLELDELLGKLQSGKSSGYDKISNELLKNASLKFKHYLLLFLNNIIANGTIPLDLNTGKCILIFKVITSSLNQHVPYNNYTFIIIRVAIP